MPLPLQDSCSAQWSVSLAGVGCFAMVAARDVIQLGLDLRDPRELRLQLLDQLRHLRRKRCGLPDVAFKCHNQGGDLCRQRGDLVRVIRARWSNGSGGPATPAGPTRPVSPVFPRGPRVGVVRGFACWRLAFVIPNVRGKLTGSCAQCLPAFADRHFQLGVSILRRCKVVVSPVRNRIRSRVRACDSGWVAMCVKPLGNVLPPHTGRA